MQPAAMQRTRARVHRDDHQQRRSTEHGPAGSRVISRAWTIRILTAWLLLLGTALVPSPAFAQHGKVDQVVMSNGDQLTCEIQNMVRAKLTVKTDGLGTLSIEWNKVVSVASPEFYEVTLESGDRQFGRLSAPAPGMLQVGPLPPVPLSLVVAIATLESNFWQRLDGSISAGFSYTQANQRTQLSLDTTFLFRSESHATRVSFDSLQATEEDVDPESRQTLSTDFQRDLGQEWYAAAISQGSRNNELGLDYRWVFGGAVGRWIARSNRTFFSVFGGASYTREAYLSQTPENRAEWLFGTRWDWFTFGDRGTDLATNSTVYLNLQDGGRIRAEIDATLSQKLVKDLKWNLSFFESYNSAPPEGEKTNDLGVTMSLGWTF